MTTSDEISDEAYWSYSDSFTPIDTLTSSEIVDDNTWFIYEDAALNIKGVFDLSMLGLESIDIEKRYLDELGEFSYNPKRYNEQGVFLCRDDEACKLLVKLEPSPVYEDKEFVNSITIDFLKNNGISFNECIDHDYDTLVLLLTPSERDHLTSIIDLMSMSFPTSEIYRNCLTLEEYNHQLVIKKKELDRLIKTLKNILQEPKLSSQDNNNKINYKQIYNKSKTQDKYLGWQKQAVKLKKKHPNKNKSWIATEIAKLPIAEGKSAETIRKNIKI
ncbi:MAG: hypothetical protein RR510_07845 [Morganella sp. (in: enterobacteria)]